MKISVDKTDAGFWIDSAVASSQGLHDDYSGWWKDAAGKRIHAACIGCDGIPTWHPSGNPDDAFELVEEMRQSPTHGPIFFAICDGTEPLTITRAYLKAKAITEIEVPK